MASWRPTRSFAAMAAVTVVLMSSIEVCIATGQADRVGGAPPGTGNDQTADLPPGRARNLVQERCTQCHTLQIITTRRAGLESWQQSVHKMKELGANITDLEAKIMSAYLANAFGEDKPPALDINSADENSLRQLPGMTGDLGASLVRYRKAHGRFRSKTDLLQVPGFSKELLDRIAPYIRVDTMPTSVNDGKSKPASP